MKRNKQFGKGSIRAGKFLVLAVLGVWFVLTAVDSLAHNLWIVGDADGKGKGTIHLYFEHWVGPGDGAYNAPIVKHGKTWVKTPQGEPVPVSMKEVTVKDTKFLVGNSGKVSGSYGIDHVSIYGIYHGQLDFFHGRYIKATDAKSLADLSESSNVPVQIVPALTEKGLLIRVLYFSTPQPRVNVWLVKEDGTEESFMTNQKGELFIGPVEPGTSHIVTRIIENEPAGAYEHEAYKGVMHGSTLTLKLTEDFQK